MALLELYEKWRSEGKQNFIDRSRKIAFERHYWKNIDNSKWSMEA